MNLLRTIQLDPSDTLVFERAATPGEWAMSGTFLFMDDDPAQLAGKRRAAFRQAFVGINSLGFSTLAVVTPASDEEIRQAIGQLAHTFIEQLGAPDLASAEAAARYEIAFAQSLCIDGGQAYPEGTVIALSRSHENGTIKEQFRALSRRPKGPDTPDWMSDARAFSIIEVDDSLEVDERIDLVSLVTPKPPLP